MFDSNIFSHCFRCAQKIITQLEIPLIKSKDHRYVKLPQEDEENCASTNSPNKESKRWWLDKKKDRKKCEEKIDNKKNEIAEKQMELKQKLIESEKIKNTDANTKESSL